MSLKKIKRYHVRFTSLQSVHFLRCLFVVVVANFLLRTSFKISFIIEIDSVERESYSRSQALMCLLKALKWTFLLVEITKQPGMLFNLNHLYFHNLSVSVYVLRSKHINMHKLILKQGFTVLFFISIGIKWQTYSFIEIGKHISKK